MREAHYFETDQPLSQERLLDILRSHGIVARAYRNPIPKNAGVILTPMSVRTFWEVSTGLIQCDGSCRGTGTEHRGWEDLTPRQKRAFNESLVRLINNHLLQSPATSLILEDPRFPGIALGECRTSHQASPQPGPAGEGGPTTGRVGHPPPGREPGEHPPGDGLMNHMEGATPPPPGPCWPTSTCPPNPDSRNRASPPRPCPPSSPPPSAPPEEGSG